MDDFEKFWQAYPRKDGRKPAKQVWDKIFKLGGEFGLVQKILKAIEAQKQSEQWRRGIIPMPKTWLREERWNDETIGAKAKPIYGNNVAPPKKEFTPTPEMQTTNIWILCTSKSRLFRRGYNIRVKMQGERLPDYNKQFEAATNLVRTFAESGGTWTIIEAQNEEEANAEVGRLLSVGITEDQRRRGSVPGGSKHLQGSYWRADELPVQDSGADRGGGGNTTPVDPVDNTGGAQNNNTKTNEIDWERWEREAQADEEAEAARQKEQQEIDDNDIPF